MMMADSGSGRNRSWVRIATLLIVVFAVVGVLAVKDRSQDQAQAENQATVPESDGAGKSGAATAELKLPRLVDLGADKCVPCKMMAPILEKLKSDLEGQCEVVFIDVWKNPKEGPKYGIKVIPTQVFFDAEGKELFRHEGFYSRDDILAAFAKHGITFNEG